MDNNTFRRVGNEEKTFKFQTPLIEQEATFPHAYFTKNPGKPPITSNSAEYWNESVSAVQQWMTGKDMLEAKMTVASEVS
jgi:hypothetical protein